MNKKHTKKLLETFPDLFKHRDNLQASLMAFGFEFSDGWYDLIYNLCNDINEYYKKAPCYGGHIPETFYVIQAKEKFGGLRFYITMAPKEVHDMIHKAEDDSYKICEYCGKKGTLRRKLPWWQTLCKSCYDKLLEGKYSKNANKGVTVR